jgi:16S rRNA (guanine527-N7)-methyltransferase
MQRRVLFLTEAVAALELPVTVRRARAQELPPASCEVIVVRALAPLTELLELALPLLRPGGRLLAVKGERAQTELAAAAEVLKGWQDVRVSLDSCGEGEQTVRVVQAFRAQGGES